MQPVKLFKFAAATVMTTVAAATVVTFSTTDQAGSSPVVAVLPRVPAAGGVAPTTGLNGQLPEPTPSTADVPRTSTAPPVSPEPESSSRSSERNSSKSSSKPSSKRDAPAPSPSPSDSNPLGDILGIPFGG